MLAHVLALAVGLGSVTLYMAAFFFPEVHRKHDFFWSGLGMFYALVLWACAGQMTGAVLLGQIASVALLGWLGWQTLVLRRVKTPLALQTPATTEAWQGFRDEMSGLLQDFASQTPLGKLLGLQRRSPGANVRGLNQAKIRASSVRDVGYEYLDELEDEAERLPKPVANASPVPAPTPVPIEVQPISAPTTSKRSRPARPSQPTRAKKPVAQPQSAKSPARSIPTPNTAPTPKAAGGMAGKSGGLQGWFASLTKSFSKPKPSRPMIEIPPREPSIPLPKKESQPQSASPASKPADSNWEDDEVWGDEVEDTIPSAVTPQEVAPPQETGAPAGSDADANADANLEDDEFWGDEVEDDTPSAVTPQEVAPSQEAGAAEGFDAAEALVGLAEPTFNGPDQSPSPSGESSPAPGDDPSSEIPNEVP